MQLEGLAAVITDGLSSSRLDVYELDTMRRLRRLEGWSRSSQLIVGTDGRLWFDIPDAVDQFMSELGRFERADEIAVVVPVARGATVALLDERGELLPREIEDIEGKMRRGGVISYVNAVSPGTDAVFDAMAGAQVRYREYGLPPNFTSYAIPARTIVSLANEYPEMVEKACRLAFGPEIIARLVCGAGALTVRGGMELTYLMCHTGLWKVKQWSPLALAVDEFVMDKTGKRLIGGLMPEAPAKEAESDFYFVDRAEPEQIAGTLVEMVKTRIPAKFRLDPIPRVAWWRLTRELARYYGKPKSLPTPLNILRRLSSRLAECGSTSNSLARTWSALTLKRENSSGGHRATARRLSSQLRSSAATLCT